MPRYIPPSIADRGLENHLDQTKSLHNDYGYADFVDMLSRDVNKANLARIFGVDVKTVRKWVYIYQKENEDS